VREVLAAALRPLGLLSPPGLHAVKFFEDTNPHMPAFGSCESEKDNPAE